MKHKKIGIILIGVWMMFMIVACNDNTKEAGEKQNTNSSTMNGEVTEQEENSQGQAEEVLQIAELELDKKQVEIYFGNEEGDALLSEVVEMESITATKIMEELVKKEVVTTEAKVIGLTKQTQEGKTRLKLNMSKEFGEYVSTMGSSGEYIIVGSLVNTFLTIYEADEVLILVEGKTFETGHQLYENYLQFFTNEN